jgi:flagellar biosynthesis protein FlhG
MRIGNAAQEPGTLTRRNGRSFKQSVLWAVGGGKGGVGKSVVTANLAISLAARGARCCVVDLDLGGANLHTLLGVPRPSRTLSHFVSGKIRDMGDLMCATSVPNVSLVSGARAMLSSANPTHSQKQKILRHLRRLDVSHVIVDLGAGTSHNVLDFFLATHRGILVVAPEPTSIENAYHFLKVAFYRSLRTVARREPVRSALETVLKDRARWGAMSPRQLIAAVASVNQEAGRRLEVRAAVFSPMLIVNQVSTREHRNVGREIATACDLYMGTPVDYLGSLDFDPSVPASVARQQPALHLFPGSEFAKGMEAIATQMLRHDFTPTRAAEPRETGNRMSTHGLVNEEEPNWTRTVVGPKAVAAKPRPSCELPALDVDAPGSYLKRCREHLGLGLSELSQKTRIRRLDRIEDERFEELPPEPYLRGYVLQYAQALGIEQAEAVTRSFLERYRAAAAHR